MDPRLNKAIYNNNGLYEAVFNCFDIPFESFVENIWYCAERVPPLYSNIVTRCEKWRHYSLFDDISQKSKEQNWASWSIKDSFNVLDLRSAGFRKLFEAQWLYLKTSEFVPPVDSGLRYELIKSVDSFTRWRAEWDSDIELGERIFSDLLLEDENVFIISGLENGEIVSGCLVNRTDDVLGISNFFCPASGHGFWTDMIRGVYDLIGKRDVVGYERDGHLLKEIQASGFETVGDLAVWEKSCFAK